MKPLWHNHHPHYYEDEHRGFGVDTTLWYSLFGTMYDFKNQDK
jgi:4-hydroxysphinganine ceramide fatty acyl 2-hydroxylase